MADVFLFSRLARIKCLLALIFSLGFSANSIAAEQSQTLILVGSKLNTCSSLNTQQCEKHTHVVGKAGHLFSVTVNKITLIKQLWPSDSQQAKTHTVKNLAAIQAKASQPMVKSKLLWLWRDIDNTQLNSLSEQEYNFVMDMLEEPQFSNQGQRLTEQVKPTVNKDSAMSDILQFITGSLKVAQAAPSMLSITAASRDPYAAADFTQGLFSSANVKSQWLAVTPALVSAITANNCEQLPQLRQSLMGLYNREIIYPDHTQAEYELCQQGVAGLVARINNSTGVYFNGEQQDLLRRVLFDENNQAYPWTRALQSRSVIVASNAGTAIQSGSSNASGKVASMVTGSSLSALRGDENKGLIYEPAGGLATFSYGVLDTQFSEQNRALRLATVLDKTQQQHGFGIDMNTALVVIKSPTGNLMTVIGKNGVVYLKAQGKQHYSYSYWPAGSIVDIKDNDFTLSARSISQSLPAVKIPPLPMQRFANILTDAKLRSLTQAMCLSQEQSSVAQQDEFLLSLTAQSDTAYYRINSSQYGCAISDLNLAVDTL